MSERLVRHHIIQRLYWWSNHEENLHPRTVEFEKAYHTLFPEMLPIERIQALLQLDSTAYNPEVVRIINKVCDSINKAWIDAYNPICFRQRNIFTKKE